MIQILLMPLYNLLPIITIRSALLDGVKVGDTVVVSMLESFNLIRKN